MNSSQNSLFKSTGFGTNSMWNGYFYINTDSQFMPYFMTGLGISSAKTDVTQQRTFYIKNNKNDTITSSLKATSSNKNYFTYQLGAGLRFNIDDAYSFDFGYRFFNMDLGKFDKDYILNVNDNAGTSQQFSQYSTNT